jgi:hypothetical protein
MLAGEARMKEALLHGVVAVFALVIAATIAPSPTGWRKRKKQRENRRKIFDDLL